MIGLCKGGKQGYWLFCRRRVLGGFGDDYLKLKDDEDGRRMKA